MDSDSDRQPATDDEDDSGPGGEERAARGRQFRDLTKTSIPVAWEHLQRNDWNVQRSLAEFFDRAESSTTSASREIIDVEAIPSEETHPNCCDRFSEMTGTNVEFASSFLPGYHWNLQAAVNAFLNESPSRTRGEKRSATGIDPSSGPSVEPKNGENKEWLAKRPNLGASPPRQQSETDVPDSSPSTPSSSKHATEISAESNPDISKRSFFKLMSWNIDGLDDKNFNARAQGVVDEIKEEWPDVVFLQEVVPRNLEKIQSQLTSFYLVLTAPSADYFVAMLLHKSTVTLQKNVVVPFSNTKMGRNLLWAEVVWKEVALSLATAHLESTKDGTSERIAQLRLCFDHIKGQKSDKLVILGGDLNLRDPEVPLAGGLPDRTTDLWQMCGSRQECRWTWDAKRNTNTSQKCAGFKSAPQCRFDRLYYRPPEPVAKIKPVHFGLVGLKKAPQSQSFPSDHWGIMCVFDSKQES